MRKWQRLAKAKKTDASQAIRDAERVFKLWETIKGSEVAGLFLLALLLDERDTPSSPHPPG